MQDPIHEEEADCGDGRSGGFDVPAGELEGESGDREQTDADARERGEVTAEAFGKIVKDEQIFLGCREK